MRFCKKCGTKKHITYHHILPRRHWKGSRHTIDLCRKCHDELEKLIPFEKQTFGFYYQILRKFLSSA